MSEQTYPINILEPKCTGCGRPLVQMKHEDNRLKCPCGKEYPVTVLHYEREEKDNVG